MTILGPTRFNRVNEALGFVFLFAGVIVTLSLVSYYPQDPSWNAVSGATKPQNLIGLAGAYGADLCVQMLGLTAFALPVFLWTIAWKWVRSQSIQAGFAKIVGTVLLLASVSTAF